MVKIIGGGPGARGAVANAVSDPPVTPEPVVGGCTER
jgi:hypothetical protein